MKGEGCKAAHLEADEDMCRSMEFSVVWSKVVSSPPTHQPTILRPQKSSPNASPTACLQHADVSCCAHCTLISNKVGMGLDARSGCWYDEEQLLLISVSKVTTAVVLAGGVMEVEARARDR